MKNPVPTILRSRSNEPGPATWAVFAAVALHLIILAAVSRIPLHRFLFVFFYASTVLVPGFSLSRVLFPGGGILDRTIRSILCGTFIFYAVVFFLTLFHVNIRQTVFVMPVLVLISESSLLFRRARGSGEELSHGPERDRRSNWIFAALACLAVLAAGLVISTGDPLNISSDSPDHLAYIRTVSTTGETFPDVNLYADGGKLTKDIRKGLSHGMWGALNAACGSTDPIPVWTIISVIGAVFMLLTVFHICMRLFNDVPTGFVAVLITLFIFMGGLSRLNLVYLAYPFLFGNIFVLLFLSSLILYLDSGNGSDLALASLASFCAVATHIGHLVLVAFLCIVISMAFIVQSGKGGWKTFLPPRILKLGAAVIGANMPYAAMRYFRDYAPNNIIHEHVQGRLELGMGMSTLNPLDVFRYNAPLMLLSIAALFLLWKGTGRDIRARAIIWGTAGIYAVVFNPLLVPPLARLISYMLIRLRSAVPPMILSAILCVSVVRYARRLPSPLSRRGAVLGGIAAVAVFSVVLSHLPSGYAYDRSSYDKAQTCYSLSDLYGRINSMVPSGSVIMSDPITSYCIPVFCDQYVVCTSDQHSVPNDSTALGRILDSREILFPDVTIAGIKKVLDRYGAEYIVVNGRIPPAMNSMYWKPDRESALRTMERLRRHPRIFEELYRGDRLALFRYDKGAVPLEADGAAVDTVFDGEKIDDEGAKRTIASGIDGIAIRSVVPGAMEVERGESLSLGIEWVSMGKIEPGSYIAYIRFDTEYEKGSFYMEWYGKLYRKLVENTRGERYRFRASHQPLSGMYSPDRWPVMTVIKDEFSLHIPRDIAPGVYDYSVKLLRHTQYPNYLIGDLLRDNDIYSGVPAGRIVIK